MPIEAKPVLQERPYLNLNPPSFLGMESTDLPVITSLILWAAASASPVWIAPLRSLSQSQPSSLYNSMSLRSLRDLPMSPSLVHEVLHLSPCWRSEEHTSELQSPVHLVCRLLLEKKK